MHSPKLKPCPFCGKKPDFVNYKKYLSDSMKYHVLDSWAVLCKNKNCSIAPMTDFQSTKKAAACDWNKRSQKPKITHCGECKYYSDYSCYCSHRLLTGGFDGEFYLVVEPWGFCSWGERRREQ